jgi:hypothetical protein
MEAAFSQNVGELQDYTASHPKLQYSYTLEVFENTGLKEY